MSDLTNSLQIDVVDAIGAEICRDERCEVLDVHVRGSHCVKMRGRETLYRTRSRKHATQPWRAYSYEALHQSVYDAVSFVEPRNFATVLSAVENDYGTCCERSVHRHLKAWRASGEIVRMDFKGRIHAYLRAGSRLLSDPVLVLEQIIDLHATVDTTDDAYNRRGFEADASARNHSHRGTLMPIGDDAALLEQLAEGTGVRDWRRNPPTTMTDSADYAAHLEVLRSA